MSRLNVASSERSGDDASPVDAPQPTMWKLNSCFDARPEYGAIGAVSTLAAMPMRESICATACTIFSSLT